MDMGDQVRLKRNTAARARRFATSMREPFEGRALAYAAGLEAEADALEAEADALEQAASLPVTREQQQTESSKHLRRHALRRHLRFLSRY